MENKTKNSNPPNPSKNNNAEVNDSLNLNNQASQENQDIVNEDQLDKSLEAKINEISEIPEISLTQNDERPVAHNEDIKTTSTSVTKDDIKKKIQVEEISPGIFRATTDTSKYIIEYDINKCIGAASCAAIAPLTFFMNEENKAEFQKEGEEWDDDEVIMAAAQSCPVFAITIIDKASNEVVFPIE
jgi:ferredoxin